MSWLRLDDGFAQHPKVAALSDREFRHWIRLLTWCARYKTGGDVPDYALRELAIGSKVRAAFVELGLLDEDDEGLTVHDWEQFNPPSGAERQKRYRDRKKNATRNVTRYVTSDEPLARARQRAGNGNGVEALGKNVNPSELLAQAWLAHAPPLIRHEPGYFDTKTKRKADEAAERFGLETLTEAIDRYAVVLEGPEYEFNHRYPFADFMARDRKEPGCSYFLDDGCFDQWRRSNGRRGGLSAEEIMEQAQAEAQREAQGSPLRAIGGGA